MEKIQLSKYFNKVANQNDSIEHRIGCANFSVIGIDASTQDRHEYSMWDSQHHERKHIAKHFNELFGYRSSADKRHAAIIDTKYQFDIARHDVCFAVAAGKKRAIGRCKHDKNACRGQQCNQSGQALAKGN